MPDIIIDSLSVAYKGAKKGEKHQALTKLDMKLQSGKINVVLGYNGCGKSTLLKAVAGIVEYTGNIYFDDVNAYKMTSKQRDVAFVRENYLLNPTLTVFDNIALALKVYKLPRETVLAEIYSITKKLGIAHTLNCRPRQLSFGQQQRVAIAKALVKKPKVCLLDEALTALDQRCRDELRLFIKEETQNSGMTCVYVTHDFNEATSIADRIFVLNDSKIILEGDPLDVLHSDNEFIKQMYEASLLEAREVRNGENY